MGKLLRMAMVLGGWRLLDRLVDRWADRGMSGNAAGRQASRPRSRKSRAAMLGVQVLSRVLRRMH